MRRILNNLIRNPITRNVSITLLVFLMLLIMPTMVSADSLTVEVNKFPSTYNIGDSVSIAGTATPNASVIIKILDPSNTTKVESEVQVASDGVYWVWDIYTLKVTDLPGTWRVNVYYLSSNEKNETTYEVISILERIEALEGQLASLQNQIQSLNTTVEKLSSRLSAIESLLPIIYGTIATAIISAVISIVTLTQYLQKRDIYRRLVGKTEKGKIKRR